MEDKTKQNEISRNINFVDPATATIVMGAIGAIVGIAGAISNSKEHRRISGQLNQIINYLSQIQKLLDSIYFQNQLILKLLTELPEVIKNTIVNEELDKSYIHLKNFYTRFVSGNLTLHDLKKDGLQDLRKSYDYIIDKEYRIEYFHNSILCSEFMLVLTKGKEIPIIQEAINHCIYKLNSSLELIYLDIDNNINMLRQLSYSEYFLNSNLETINKLSAFHFDLAPPKSTPKTVKEEYNCIVHNYPGSAEMGPRRECQYRDVIINEINQEWLSNQSKYNNLINEKLSYTNKRLIQYADIKTIKTEFESYLNIISENSNHINRELTNENEEFERLLKERFNGLNTD